MATTLVLLRATVQFAEDLCTGFANERKEIQLLTTFERAVCAKFHYDDHGSLANLYQNYLRQPVKIYVVIEQDGL